MLSPLQPMQLVLPEVALAPQVSSALRLSTQILGLEVELHPLALNLLRLEPKLLNRGL